MNSSSAINQQVATLNNVIEYMHKYVATAICIFGNLGNLLSILIFLKKSWKKNVCVFYFKFFILVNSCYINSTILASIFMDGFQINLQDSNVILCKLYLYTSFLFITLSPTFLILASIDRLLISSQNVDTRLYSSKRLAYFSISISALFWIGMNMHALIKGEIEEIFPSYFGCAYRSSRVYYNFVIYFSGVLNVVYCLVMIILCIVSFKNVRRIRAAPRGKRTQQIRTMNKKDFQLLRCLFVQDLVYVFFSTMAISFYVYQTLTADRARTAWDQALLIFIRGMITILYSTYFASSFFIFVIVSKAFRHELKRMIYKMIGKRLNPVREEENRPENPAKDNLEMNAIPTIVLQA